MRLKFNLSIVLFCSLIFCLPILAQPGKQPIQLGVNLHHGFLLNHSPKRTNTSNPSLNTINGVEISALWQTLGTKPWHKYYGFPKWGVSFIYYSIGSANTFVMYDKGDSAKYNVNWGDCYTLLIHSSLKPIVTPRFELNIRLGTGLGYFTSIYNRSENPGNLWISSRINPAMHLTIEGQFKISPQWAFVLGGTFTHFSNGATRMPNLGINLPTLNVGLRFTPFPSRLKYKTDSIYSIDKKNYFHVSFAFGLKVIAEFGTTYYPTSTFSFMYGRRVNKVCKLLASLDAFRDQSLINELDVENKSIDRLGIWLGNEFMHGQLGFILGAGHYIYKSTERDANFYFKIGIRRYFNQKIFCGVMLKTHYGQADNFEWTLGYNL